MSRDERRSRTGSASEVGPARTGGGFGSVDEAESICFGCSMLSRIRMRPRKPGAFGVMRCSLGYALHSEEDVARCLNVEGPGDCWKTVPSWRIPALEAPGRDRLAGPAETHVVTLGLNGSTRSIDQAAVLKQDDAADPSVAEVVVERSEKVVEYIHPCARTGTDSGHDD